MGRIRRGGGIIVCLPLVVLLGPTRVRAQAEPAPRLSVDEIVLPPDPAGVFQELPPMESLPDESWDLRAQEIGSAFTIAATVCF